MAYVFATNRGTMKELKGDEAVVIPQNANFFRQFILTSSDPNKENIFSLRKSK